MGPGGATAFTDSSGNPLLAYHAWRWPDANYPSYPRCERENTCERGQRRLHITPLEVRDEFPIVARRPAVDAAGSGYWLLGLDGTIWTAGSAQHLGEPSGNDVRAVDLQATPGADGYWVLDRTGVVWAFGAAPQLEPRRPRTDWRSDEVAVGLTCRPARTGCWIVTSRGRVVPLGDAPFLGDLSALTLRSDVTAIAGSPRGSGYSLLTADGGVAAFGDSPHPGPMPLARRADSSVSLVPDPDGAGYWIAGGDGSVRALDAPELDERAPARPRYLVRDLTPFGDGLLMVAEDGEVFARGGIAEPPSLNAERGDRPFAVFVAVAAS